MKIVSNTLSTTQFNNWRARYSGTLYIPGFTAGAISLEEFLKTLPTSSVENESPKLKGNYFALIENCSTGAWWLFCDMSGMSPLFYTENWASPSIRTLVHLDPSLTADHSALAEFLIAGSYDRRKYPIAGVQRLRGQEILHGAPNQATSLIEKRPLTAQISDDAGFIQSMQELANSFCGQTLGLDLTSGWDSRLNLATLLNGPANIECGLAAHEDHPDAIIARRLAERVGIPFYLTSPKKNDEITENVIRSIVSAGDGLIADIETMDRKSDLMKDRATREVALSVDGTGGELYKDFWWLQDFPFYGTKRVNISRLISTRAHLARSDSYQLTPAITAELNHARERIQTRMESRIEGTNIQTYDRIYRERMYGISAQLSATCIRSTGTATYSPYLEESRVVFASTLDIRDRIADSFQRRIVSERLPETLDIPTDKGTYANDSLGLLVFRYGRMFGGRAINKAWQMRTGRWLFGLRAPGNKPAYLDAILRSSLWHDALDSLIRNNFIEDAASVNESSYVVVTRLLTVATILADFEKASIVDLPKYESIIDSEDSQTVV